MGCAQSDSVTSSSSNSQHKKEELKVYNEFVYKQAPQVNNEQELLHRSMQLSLYPQANIQVEIEEEKSELDSIEDSVDNQTSIQPNPPCDIQISKQLQLPNCEQLLLIMINELKESGQLMESLKLIEQNASKYPEGSILSKLVKMVRQNNEKSINEKLEDKFYRFFQAHLLGQIIMEREKCIELSSINHQLLIHYAKFILRKGMSYMSNKFYEKAEKKFEAYAEIAKITGSILMLCEGRRCLGLIQHKKGNFIKAIQIFMRCVDTMNEANISPAERLKPLKNLAEVYVDQQRYEKALEVYAKCEAIVNQVGSIEEEEIKLMELIGQVQWKRRQYELAHSYFQKCLDIQSKATGLSSYESVGYLIKLSIILSESGSSQSCLDILEGCLKTLRQSQWEAKKKRETELSIQKILFNHYKNKGQYIEALQCLYTSLALIELNEGKANLDYSEILKEIGIIQELQYNYHESLKFYDQSLAIKQKISSKDERSHIEVIMKKANIYQKLNNHSKSLKYKDNIIKIQQKYKHSHQKEHLNTFINIAKKTLQKGNYPQSLIYYQKCVNILQDQKGKDCIELAQVYRDIGSVYKLQGVYKESMGYFNQCLAILQRHKGKDCIEAAQSYYQLASIYEEINNYESAQAYYKNALIICEKYNIKYQTYANSNLGLGNLYFCQSLYSQSYKAYEKSLTVLEKMNPNKYHMAIQQMQACDRLIQMQFPSQKDVQNED